MFRPIKVHHQEVICTLQALWCNVMAQQNMSAKTTNSRLVRIFVRKSHRQTPFVVAEWRRLCKFVLQGAKKKNCDADRRNKQDGRPLLAQQNLTAVTAMLALFRRIWIVCRPRAASEATKSLYAYLLTSFPFSIYLDNVFLFSGLVAQSV